MENQRFWCISAIFRCTPRYQMTPCDLKLFSGYFVQQSSYGCRSVSTLIAPIPGDIPSAGIPTQRHIGGGTLQSPSIATMFFTKLQKAICWVVGILGLLDPLFILFFLASSGYTVFYELVCKFLLDHDHHLLQVQLHFTRIAPSFSFLSAPSLAHLSPAIRSRHVKSVPSLSICWAISPRLHLKTGPDGQENGKNASPNAHLNPVSTFPSGSGLFQQKEELLFANSCRRPECTLFSMTPERGQNYLGISPSSNQAQRMLQCWERVKLAISNAFPRERSTT